MLYVLKTSQMSGGRDSIAQRLAGMREFSVQNQPDRHAGRGRESADGGGTSVPGWNKVDPAGPRLGNNTCASTRGQSAFVGALGPRQQRPRCCPRRRGAILESQAADSLLSPGRLQAQLHGPPSARADPVTALSHSVCRPHRRPRAPGADELAGPWVIGTQTSVLASDPGPALELASPSWSVCRP